MSDDERVARLGWGRAVITTLVIVVVGVALLVYVPNWVLTHLDGVSRNGRVAIATIEFVAALAGMLWVLRRLQARGAI